MKIKQQGSLFKTRLLRAFPLVVTFGAVLYSLFEVVISGIIPSRYITIASVVLLLLAVFMIFLWYRYFATKRRRVVARVATIVLMLILLIVSIFGLYVLKRGLSTLDGLSDNANSVTVDTKRSFNIYISGIDTYGDISTTSRSDVNIVATVNPNTHQILLTTAPRDSYVSIAGGGNGGMDKLTHAGIYGPESSMQTMAQLLDTDIDAYARINFSSFIESIDVLGGITVQNPTAFT